MPKSFTPKDVELLGYTTAEIRNPQEQVGYTIIDATAAGGLETIRTQFIYLKSKCTPEDAKAAAALIESDLSTHIVTPPSASRRSAPNLWNARPASVPTRNSFGKNSARSLTITSRACLTYTSTSTSSSTFWGACHWRRTLFEADRVHEWPEESSGRDSLRPLGPCRRRQDYGVATPDPQAR